MEILIQAIGFGGVIASTASFQSKKHGKILFFRTLNEFFFAIQYFLLGAYTGTAMNLLGCVRNVIFTRQVEKKKSTKYSVIVFSILFTVFGIITWQGAKSILIIVAKFLSTVAYGNKNTTIVRGLTLITSTSWLIYNAFVFSIAGILCEAFTIVSLIAGIIRFDLMPRLNKNNE